jgi:hypothetical protein
VIGFGRKFANRFQLARRIKYNPAVFFISDPCNALHGLARFDSLDDFEEGFLALSFDDDVDVFGRERLVGQQ